MEGAQTYVALPLVIIAVVGLMITIRYWQRAAICRRRMYRMMLTCGIDDATARNPDEFLDVDMQQARRRCRRCPSPETCDRWLNGEAIPGNDFCPNAERFTSAAEAPSCCASYDPARRPGRRLDT